MPQSTTLLRILFHDLCNQPMPNLYHEIRENGRTISAGNSDGEGYGVWMKRQVGKELDVAVKDPRTGTMTTLPTRIIVQKPKTSNAHIARVQAPFYKQAITLQPRQGTQGDYRRKTHTVKKGETLEGIAKQYNTTSQILHNLNKDKIKDPDKIQVGWVLKIPPKNSGLRDSGANTDPKTQPTKNTQTNPYTKPKITTSNYQVEQGDTLGSIAGRCGKSISDLQRLNGITDPNKIKAGQYIKTGVPEKPTLKPTSQQNPTQQHKQSVQKATTKITQHSTNHQSSDILSAVQEMAEDGADWLGQQASSARQTISSGAGQIADSVSGAVSGWFSDKIPQSQTPPQTQKPKPTEIKPVQTTTQNERSQEGGTPKVVVSSKCATNPACITSGKSELIREINIRLAGFGGALPTDEFTELTANCIKQFQRDYMKAPETGKICGSLLAALDRFNKEYPIASYTKDMPCPCGVCGGYGKGRYNVNSGGNFANEYPGIHRSLIWILKALEFYLTNDKEYKSRNLSVAYIYSGYRCIDNNTKKGRTSVNHMGLALDIHFNKKEIRTKELNDMEFVRKVMKEKMKALEIRENNRIYLEPKIFKSGKSGATTWVHYDMTKFDEKYISENPTLNKPSLNLLVSL